MTLALKAEGFNHIKSTSQVAAVSRPLWSVRRICDEGFEVKLSKTEAVVMQKDGKVDFLALRFGIIFETFSRGTLRQAPKLYLIDFWLVSGVFFFILFVVVCRSWIL